MKKGILITLLWLLVGQLLAIGDNTDNEPTDLSAHDAVQTKKISVNVDFLSQHLWRGRKSGGSASVEPTITWQISPRFSLSGWGAYCFDGSFNEIDIYCSYKIKNFTITVLDYYCPGGGAFFGSQLTDFSKETQHLGDLVVDYKFKHFPVKLSGSVLFAGNDKNPDNGDNYYSTYLEASYTGKYKKLSYGAIAGLTPKEGLYASKARFVNFAATTGYELGSVKGLRTSIKASMVYNPVRDKLYFITGLSIKL
ncbi:hypothetical protein EYV94_22170 [Puteibacter caeruleilacunae]|nr:hypothetical protein EYV94_22170 [Puteibacter caeruleilacunae]